MEDQYYPATSFREEYPFLWENLLPQQPPAGYQEPLAAPQYFHDTSHDFYGPPVANAPYLHVPRTPIAPYFTQPPVIEPSAPKPKAKQATKASKEPDKLKYTGRDLRDIVETALEVQLFTAKHGEKGKKLVEFGTAVRKLGVKGSDTVLKSRLLEVLAYHEDPASAPAPIVKAIQGTSFEITLGAPLDRLAAERRSYADKTDANKEKMLKEAAENKRGGNIIRNASMVASRRTAARRAEESAEESDGDDVEVLDTAPPARVAVPPLSTPARLRSLPPLRDDRTPPPPDTLLLHKGNDSDDEIECIGYNAAPPRASAPTPISIKTEPEPPTIPTHPVAKSVTKQRGIKLETPVHSIPRSSRKSSSKKHTKDDSDIENSPPTPRKTKRVRRNGSFDLEAHLLEERKLRLEERKHRNEFEERLLGQVRQSNADFNKLAESTQTFQTEFLGILHNIFKN
ncbi:hypothetical protein MVEN_01114000 [Mycena venus]|uniref:Uncharacterized protein n=1 Tax=Mycena venus TaxID=2733690 RepID=A0A8H6Y9Y9_9AGAR|nr:hypothetical protein MVEN_01114000 [Mycena venus]